MTDKYRLVWNFPIFHSVALKTRPWDWTAISDQMVIYFHIICFFCFLLSNFQWEVSRADLFTGIKIWIYISQLSVPFWDSNWRHVLHLAAMCIRLRPSTASMSPLTLHLQSWHHYCTALPQRLFLSNQLREPCHHRNHRGTRGETHIWW